ncbi:shieldin complex subunit 1 [Lithobates pipiens]
MEPPRAAASQSPQSSGVLDLSCTYDISKSLLHPEPATATLVEDSSCALTWASPASSLNYTGHRTSDCEDSEKIRLEDDERLSALSPSSSSSIVREQRSSTITRLETNEDIDDAQLRANLDAFYELSSLPGDDEFSRQLTEKILELKQKNHLYALRSFQMGKIILRQEGTNVLQSSVTDNVFSSTGETLNIKPVAGLSDDVIRFLKDRNSTKKGP